MQAAPKKSAAKSNEKIDILGKYRDSKTGKLSVRYRYAGTFVLDNELQDVVKIRLPLNLDTIRENSSDECFSYGSRYRMAYFWNPVGKGCKLVEGVDYFTADATIVKKLANTTNTCAGLRAADQRNGEIRIVLAFGADDDHKGKLPPDKNDDYNAAKLPGHAEVPARSRPLGSHHPRRRARA